MGFRHCYDVWKRGISMYIERLIIQDFGKYHEQEIELKQGINLIYGANEAGKTTIQAFMMGMLFGTSSFSERELEAWTKHWKPRKGKGFRGVMEWMHEGKRYCLSRNFHTGEAVLEIKANGKTQSITESVRVQEQLDALLQVTRQEYQDTLCINSDGVGYSEALCQSIKEQCRMRHEGSNSSQSLKQAYQYLQQQRERWNRAGIEHALQTLEQKQKDLHLEEQLRQLTEQREALEQELLRLSGETCREQMNTPKKQKTGMWKRMLEKGQADPQMRLILNMVKVLLGFGICSLIFILIFMLPVSLYYKGWLTVIVVVVAIYGCIMYAISKKRRTLSGGVSEQTEVDSTRILECSHQLAELQIQENELLKENSRQQEYQVQHQKLEKQLSELEETWQVIDLAETTIRRLAEQESTSYVANMSRTSSKWMGRITRGRYTDVCLDSDLRIQLATSDGTWDCSQLSTGTREQIWLAVRLAAAEELQEKHLPVLLDDIFGSYDDQRLQAVIECLQEYPAEQVIFFASDDRLADCLDQIESKYGYIEL